MAKTMAIVGTVAFVVGVLFAIIGGIWGGDTYPTNHLVIWVLLVAGVLIGLLNITAKEGATVLAAAVALIILGIWGFTPAAAPIALVSKPLADNLQGVVCCFALLMAPAAFIIAIKAVISTAKPGD